MLCGGPLWGQRESSLRKTKIENLWLWNIISPCYSFYWLTWIINPSLLASIPHNLLNQWIEKQIKWWIVGNHDRANWISGKMFFFKFSCAITFINELVEIASSINKSSFDYWQWIGSHFSVIFGSRNEEANIAIWVKPGQFRRHADYPFCMHVALFGAFACQEHGKQSQEFRN